MRLAARAWLLREAARDAIAAGHFGRARELAQRAAGIQGGGPGTALELLSVWLGAAALKSDVSRNGSENPASAAEADDTSQPWS